MFIITILPLAKDDIEQAVKWYENKQKGLGKRFLKELKSKIDVLKNSPLIFKIKYDNVRTVSFNRFPFMIHFIIEENKIIIAAVLHTSRNPEIWKR